MQQILDFFLHVDKKLLWVVSTYGPFTYLILFLIVFMETGLVVTPFLPGDSLLFAAGAFAAQGSLNITVLFILLSIAAIVGDTVNYWIGHFIGPKAFTMHSKLLKREYLEKAQKFYDKHGGKAIVLARFVPIVRTFAPFVAGVGKMDYQRFLFFNVTGGLFWVSLFLFGGYFFGAIPFIAKNFEVVVVVIILFSVVPIIYEVIKHKLEKKSK
jgi:membrane-associated protein